MKKVLEKPKKCKESTHHVGVFPVNIQEAIVLCKGDLSKATTQKRAQRSVSLHMVRA